MTVPFALPEPTEVEPDAVLEWAILLEELGKVAREALLPKKGDPEILPEQVGAIRAGLRAAHEAMKKDAIRSQVISPNYERYQDSREVLMLELTEMEKILDQIEKDHKIRYQRAKVRERQEKFDD